MAAAVLFAVLYVVVIAHQPSASGAGDWRTTTFGSAIDDPASFLRVLVDSITFAGALFIVASGFALIFGLMRVVNMAHGSFYLLGGYIAYEIQQAMTGQGFSIASSEVNTWDWLVPLFVAVPCIAVVGLATNTQTVALERQADRVRHLWAAEKGRNLGRHLPGLRIERLAAAQDQI